MNEALLSEIKNYLDISWDDPDTNQKYAGLIKMGSAYLEQKAGQPLDFLQEEDALALLKDYVRYARDGAMDVFENNYRHLILAMQNERRMNRASVSLSPQQ